MPQAVKRKDLITLLECLMQAYRSYCLNQLMHRKLTSRDVRYRRFNEYWNVILRSTQFQYLVLLASIFSRPDERSVTIYYFLDYKFEKYEKLLADLRKLRNKYLVHLDIKQTRNLEAFMKRLDLKRDKFEPLFDLLIREVVLLAEHYKLPGDLKKGFKMSARRAENEFIDLFTALKNK